MVAFMVIGACMAFHQAKFCYAGPDWYTKIETDMLMFQAELDPPRDIEDALIKNFSVKPEFDQRIADYRNARLHFEKAASEASLSRKWNFPASLRLGKKLSEKGLHPLEGYITEARSWEDFAVHSYRAFVETDTAFYYLESALKPLNEPLSRSLEESRLMEISTIADMEFTDELNELAYRISREPQKTGIIDSWREYHRKMNARLPECESARKCVEANHKSSEFFTKCLAYYNNSECVYAQEKNIPRTDPPFGADVEIEVKKIMEQTFRDYGVFLNAYRMAENYAVKSEINMISRMEALTQRITLFDLSGYDFLEKNGFESTLAPIVDTKIDFDEILSETTETKKILDGLKTEKNLYHRISKLQLAKFKVDAIENSMSQIEALIEMGIRTSEIKFSDEIQKMSENELHPQDAEILQEFVEESDNVENFEWLELYENFSSVDFESYAENRLLELKSMIEVASRPVKDGGEGVDVSEIVDRMPAEPVGKDDSLLIDFLEAMLHEKVDKKWKAKLNEKRKSLIETQEEARAIGEALGVEVTSLEVPSVVMDSKGFFGSMGALTEAYGSEIKRLDDFVKKSDSSYLSNLRHELTCTPQTSFQESVVLRCSLKLHNFISQEGKATQRVPLEHKPAEKITDINLLSPEGVSISSSGNWLTVKHYAAAHSSKTIIFEYLTDEIEKTVPVASEDVVNSQKNALSLRTQLAEIEEKVAEIRSLALIAPTQADLKEIGEKISETEKRILEMEKGVNSSVNLYELDAFVDNAEKQALEKVLPEKETTDELSVPYEIKTKVEETFGISFPEKNLTLSEKQADGVSEFLENYQNFTSKTDDVNKEIKKKARASLLSANSTLSEFNKLRGNKMQKEYDELSKSYLNAKTAYEAGKNKDALYWALYTYDGSRKAMTELKKPDLKLPLVLALTVAGGGALAYKKKLFSRPKRIFGELR